MLSSLVLLVITIGIITAAFLPYSYTIDSMMQRHKVFASGDGGSDGLSDGSDGDTNSEPTNGDGGQNVVE